MSGGGGLAQYVLGAVPHGRTAIVAADGTGPLTGRALADRARRGAAGLAALGVGHGDVVALHLPNVPDFAPALCAVLRAGAAAVLCSPLATEEELAGQLALSRAAVVVTAPALRASARAAAVRAGVAAVLDLLPDRRAAESAAAPVVVRAGDPAVLALSSGTTGLPKCAVLTHGGLVANLRQAAGPLPLGTDDVLLALTPFAHVMGVCGVLLRGLAAGATVVTLDRFTPAAFVGALSRHRVTQTIVPPPLVDLLATSALVDRYDLSALRVVYVGGAGAGAELERACAQRLGCVVAQGYGMTEGGPMITVNPVDGRARPGSAGLPLPGVRIRIVRDGREVPAGSSGEVHVAGPGLMAGYLGDPEATRRVLGADGWLRTGDAGHVDGEGYLWITDRLKDLIKCKGHQVSPAEVEAVLTRHPAVAEAAVVGRPDARAGEVPVAFVTLRAPASPEELVRFVAARVSAPKRIHEARIVGALPRGPTGKVLRRELRRPRPP
ncbi:AMP-binding protein [Streptomyces monashensis]|uniref:class I adenylate-forming enzyme family protein n=1 Tax=Streptomyces monashensis TaxID=1678012 RepID=UPI0033F93298